MALLLNSCNSLKKALHSPVGFCSQRRITDQSDHIIQHLHNESMKTQITPPLSSSASHLSFPHFTLKYGDSRGTQHIGLNNKLALTRQIWGNLLVLPVFDWTSHFYLFMAISMHSNLIINPAVVSRLTSKEACSGFPQTDYKLLK